MPHSHTLVYLEKKTHFCCRFYKRQIKKNLTQKDLPIVSLRNAPPGPRWRNTAQWCLDACANGFFGSFGSSGGGSARTSMRVVKVASFRSSTTRKEVCEDSS